MSIKDRTNEFHKIVGSYLSRATNSSSSKSGLENRKYYASTQQSRLTSPKSEFSRMASVITRDLRLMEDKLQQLGKLANRRTLFDDKPTEINDLTQSIKQDIARLNNQIEILQRHLRENRNRAPNKQVIEHSEHVINRLRARLADASVRFKDVLEMRTQNIKESKERLSNFSHSDGSMQMRSDSPLYITERSNEAKSEYLSLEMGPPMQQQMLVEEQSRYNESRATAIQSIESTIAELGNIFGQLAHMVAEQRETIQRIDADVDDIESNVQGAQRELLKYYRNISSNRWLMLKVFGVIIATYTVFSFVY
ncbi:uncharacterized protein VTP21DRAFT_6636 [Calcarisporiella thermophila]|uniref:uncharacterized protein n=1 Tax=Calcarisporiella thermophila TaxID=911321 RepID=UPI003743307F